VKLVMGGGAIHTAGSSSMGLDGRSFPIECVVGDSLQFDLVAGESALDG
jgi:hypothetical protein